MSNKTSANAPVDLQDHLQKLERLGLLQRIEREIDKNSELHPLVRWQFQGGIPAEDRKAFLFNNVTDTNGKNYEMPVVVGALAANPEIYAAGLGVSVDEIGDVWLRAMDNPIPPETVNDAPCQEVVMTGEDLTRPGGGLASLPVPISTPGFDAAPYLTATLVITKDPETGIHNMGTYRAQLEARDR